MSTFYLIGNCQFCKVMFMNMTPLPLYIKASYIIIFYTYYYPQYRNIGMYG